MTDKLKPIDEFADKFFEWDGGKKTPYVTLTSAKMFAEEWAKCEVKDVVNQRDALVENLHRLKGNTRAQPTPTSNAGEVMTNYGWKCNCCRQVFTHEQKERKPDNNGGAPCPFCKAHGQYTYPFQLHDGDPCKNCGKPHDNVEPGECRAATAEADLAKARDELHKTSSAIELVIKGMRGGYLKDWLMVRNGETHLLSDDLNAALQSARAWLASNPKMGG